MSNLNESLDRPKINSTAEDMDNSMDPYSVDTPSKKQHGNVKQYFNHNIDLKGVCKEYRKSINKKF